MNCHQYARWRSYQKTLMAVYWLSEPDGLRCYATWKELSQEIGLCVDTVKHYVRRLEEAGVIRIPKVWDRPNRRTIVLLDHPDAADYLASLERRRQDERARFGQVSW
jgi:DNA-binding Lrp family transcriptional regulator